MEETNISQILKACRQKAGITQAQFAETIHPGEIELTRTLPARLTANACVNAETPPFAAV